MIRRSPCEYYLKYLVSHPANYSDGYIQEEMARLGLDWLGEEHLARIRKQTIRPVPFRPYDKEHLASQYFLNKHRIYSLYFKDDAIRGALYILEHPKVKEFTEAMTLAGAPPALVARGVSHGISQELVTDSAVKRFRHYFWNTDLLDFTEMRALVAKRGTNSTDKDFKKAYYRDSRKIACDLPFNPLSALLSQIRMGITPAGVNFAELMERVRIVAGIKAYQWVMDDGLRSGENARHFIGVAVEATELLERSANPEEKLRDRINSLGIDNDSTPIPHINRLSEGRHTTDLQATEARAEVVEVDDES
jgi:hypothetical protein